MIILRYCLALFVLEKINITFSPAIVQWYSLALLDCFLFRWKKGSGERPMPFCSRDLQFLGIVDWPLIATKSCILVRMM